MFEKFPKIPRLNREMVITEKIDGTNAQVYIVHAAVAEGDTQYVADKDGLIMLAGSRSRWLGLGKSEDNHGFARWVQTNQDSLWDLGPGRHFGEWYGQGINRGYGLDHKRFALFNCGRWTAADKPAACDVVPILFTGNFSTDWANSTLHQLRQSGSHAAPGYMNPEGIIIFHCAGRMVFKATLGNDGGKHE